MSIKENEYGDKLGKPEICQGILLILCVVGTLVCLCARGCKYVNDHRNKTAEKAKVIQVQKQLSNQH